MSKIKAIIFDVDQTLTVEVSWLKFTRLLGADEAKHSDIFQKFKTGELSYPKAKSQLLKLWLATDKANVFTIRDIFRSFEFSQGTEDIIKYLQAKGYKLCLISGSMDLYIEIVAQRLKIDDWYASTKMHFEADGKLYDFDYTLGRGEEKLKFFDQFCALNNIEPEECAAVGDGDTDMPIFEKVALPILFVAPETTKEQQGKVKTKIKKLIELKKYL